MKLIKSLYKGIKAFGEDIAIIVNSILLSVVYFLGIGLTSIFGKLFRKKFLDLKPTNQKTYWTDLNIGKRKMEEYYKQF